MGHKKLVMRRQLLEYICCPVSGSSLDLYPFEMTSSGQSVDVRFGVLKSREGGYLYPIIEGVPSLVIRGLPPWFLHKFAERLVEVRGQPTDDRPRIHDEDWSFSREWETFYENDVQTTWGWTSEERLKMFFQETNLEPQHFRDALVCDAGCGNGLLTEKIASLGAQVIGVDYSTSVYHAEARRKSDNIHYIRADLQFPPLKPASFDVIISNGVLHHTPSTRHTFSRVASLVKTDGRFYLWLYRRSGDFKHRLLQLREALIRPICSRMPPSIKSLIVHVDAAILWGAQILFARRRCTFSELLVGSYDSLTPRFAWQHHTPIEVASWFFENGFCAPSLTHWDNPNGFGMVAIKHPQQDTPGVNFGKHQVAKRFFS